MRLVDGAQAIRGDLPSAHTIVVDVPLEAGESQDSAVARLTSIQLVRDRVAAALASIDGLAITIGGDCAVALAPVSRALDAEDLDPKNTAGGVALVWFDAHPDLNTPESSPSSAFHGMIVRTLLGDGAPGLVPARPLSPERLVLVGTRALDDPEDAYVTEAGIRMLPGENLDAAELVAAITATGATSVYLHVDLDVLDPGEIEGVGFPEPFGPSAATLVELIRAVKASFPLAGAGITEFAPASPEQAANDMPTILRIIGALAN
ncbi:MAG: arginase family protein [Glaciihabitans sp.]|jgi:arginase|nr:arginase family protein [Glaciihabitans sp.]